ncbi:MAG: hypothetical protein ILNGONEN_01408 [Syntrophorhabdaceae bacterium]|nr:hypothetical protein [Syntrophorhabdaceae bacterium]
MANNISPILRHTIESFEHGIFHYLDNTDIGRKFSLLHIDHAIELIVKEKLLRLGKSIYKNDGKTLSIHEAFNSIEKEVSIPERPRLEDLHDLRNTVQHKGLAIDELTTEFYVTEGYNFIKRFLNDELGISVADLLPPTYIKAMEGVSSVPSHVPAEIKSRLQEAERLYSSAAFEMSVVAAYVAYEITLRSFAPSTEKFVPPMKAISYLVENKLSKEIALKFREVANLRNRAVHTGNPITKEEARKALDVLNEIISSLYSGESV